MTLMHTWYVTDVAAGVEHPSGGFQQCGGRSLYVETAVNNYALYGKAYRWPRNGILV
jgi:hypothetical protein